MVYTVVQSEFKACELPKGNPGATRKWQWRCSYEDAEDNFKCFGWLFYGRFGAEIKALQRKIEQSEFLSLPVFSGDQDDLYDGKVVGLNRFLFELIKNAFDEAFLRRRTALTIKMNFYHTRTGRAVIKVFDDGGGFSEEHAFVREGPSLTTEYPFNRTFRSRKSFEAGFWSEFGIGLSFCMHTFQRRPGGAVYLTNRRDGSGAKLVFSSPPTVEGAEPETPEQVFCLRAR